jgi:hypothetical protein
MKSEQITLHLTTLPLIGLANYLMRLISIQNFKITNVQLQIGTAQFKKWVVLTVSVLIHTRQSNINAETNDDGEYNFMVRV